MRQQLICATAAMSLLAAPALAQQSTTGAAEKQNTPAAAQMTTGATAASPAMTQAGNSASGITQAKSANFAVRFVSAKPADLTSSKLVGMTVYNNQNEKLGEIEDLTIDNGKTLSGVVVSVGGFLGIGESYVLIDPSTIVVNNDNGIWKAFVDTSKDTLKSAPKFTYAKAKS